MKIFIRCLIQSGMNRLSFVFSLFPLEQRPKDGTGPKFSFAVKACALMTKTKVDRLAVESLGRFFLAVIL